MRCYSFILVAFLCCSIVQAQRRALLDVAIAPAPALATDAMSATAWSDPSAAESPSSAAPAVPAATPRGNQTPPGSPAPPPPPPPPPPIYYAPWVSPDPAAQASAPTSDPSSTPSQPSAPSQTSTPSPTSTPSSVYTPPVVSSAPGGAGAPAPSTSTTPADIPAAPGPLAAGKTSPEANVPAVSAVIVLPNYVLQSFDTAAQAQFIRAIESAYPLNNIAVKINSISPGSVIVNETTTFLDGDTKTAANNVAALTASPQDIFPSIAFGNVTVSNVTMGNVTNPVPAAATHTLASGAGQFAVASMSVVMGAAWLISFAM